MANMTPTEKGLIEALNQWTIKQGVVLTQVNPYFFMQVLRDQGLDIVQVDDLAKIRYEHKYLRELIGNVFKNAMAAKTKLEQLDISRELLSDNYMAEKPTVTKRTRGVNKSGSSSG